MAETVRSLGKRSKEEKDWVALAWINLKKKEKSLCHKYNFCSIFWNFKNNSFN